MPSICAVELLSFTHIRSVVLMADASDHHRHRRYLAKEAKRGEPGRHVPSGISRQNKSISAVRLSDVVLTKKRFTLCPAFWRPGLLNYRLFKPEIVGRSSIPHQAKVQCICWCLTCYKGCIGIAGVAEAVCKRRHNVIKTYGNDALTIGTSR